MSLAEQLKNSTAAAPHIDVNHQNQKHKAERRSRAKRPVVQSRKPVRRSAPSGDAGDDGDGDGGDGDGDPGPDRAALLSGQEWLRKWQVRRRYGNITTRTIDRAVAEGRFPKPRYLFGTQIPFWSRAELDAHDRAMVAKTAA